MRRISDHFQPPDEYMPRPGTRYFAVISGADWLRLGLPPVKPMVRIIYSCLYAFTDTRGMKIREINDVVYSPSTKNVKAIKNCLDVLVGVNLAIMEGRHWFAVLPEINWRGYPFGNAVEHSMRVTNVTDPVTNVTNEVTNVTNPVTNET